MLCTAGENEVLPSQNRSSSAGISHFHRDSRRCLNVLHNSLRMPLPESPTPLKGPGKSPTTHFVEPPALRSALPDLPEGVGVSLVACFPFAWGVRHGKVRSLQYAPPPKAHELSMAGRVPVNGSIQWSFFMFFTLSARACVGGRAS